ncbi:hypothetical protein ACFC1T_16920 [Kitasatospora sp. NPDC056076]|uniref:hypothetical protein n=1 Tax=Kitasatospora sp. NPDC056076 TaxID=3345703 RepID=UPI0035D6CB82
MARVYATAAQLAAFLGQAAPPDADRLLARASAFLDSQVFRLAVYNANTTTGMPTDQPVLDAFANATCAQVEWWQGVGDMTGAAGAGWSTVRIGTAHMQRPDGNVSGMASPAREVAPAVWDYLNSPDLVDLFRVGSQWTGLGW